MIYNIEHSMRRSFQCVYYSILFTIITILKAVYKCINIFSIKMNDKIQIPGRSWNNIKTHCYTSRKHIRYITRIKYLYYFLKKRNHVGTSYFNYLLKQNSL